MLWRDAYQPRVFERIHLPEDLGSRVLLGAFDFRAQSEIGVWWRLLESASIKDGVNLAFLRSSWTPQDQRLAEAVLPRSLHPIFQLREDVGEEWRALIQPDRPERSFAAITKGRRAELLVVGPPTEDVWERFEALLLNP